MATEDADDLYTNMFQEGDQAEPWDLGGDATVPWHEQALLA